MSEPLVAVGIPTYNRAPLLARSVESVLAQTHANLELVISDNASGDGTEEYCRELCERDGRVRYLRSDVNRGPTANFNTLFDVLGGDYAMVLSDDDWLDEDYLASCLAELLARPELVLVCGRARYLREGVEVRRGADIQVLESSATGRVRNYIGQVDENGVFYGLMAREVMRRATPLRNVLGNDWLVAAAVAMQGPVATIERTAINRELDGTSADFAKLCATLGLPAWQARVPHLVIASEVAADIGWRSGVYRELSPPARVWLALRAGWAAISWRSLAWHLTMPTFGRLEQGRLTAPIGHLYRRITRMLGAGREG
jgi:hypothetical protein